MKRDVKSAVIYCKYNFNNYTITSDLCGCVHYFDVFMLLNV